MKPVTKAAYNLLHEGTISLAQIEANGIRIDVDYLNRAIKDTEAEITRIEQGLHNDEVFKAWKKRFGKSMNLDSGPQLGEVLFGIMKVPCEYVTPSGRPKTDEATLETVDLPFIREFFKAKKLKKAVGTSLKGILREVCGEFLHPEFHLNIARSYRSCVAKDTLIEVVRDVRKSPKGVSIQNVRAGDYVYCYNDKLKLTIKKVLWAGKTGHRKVIRLHWLAKGKRGYLDVTPEHRIRIATGQYIKACELLDKPNLCVTHKFTGITSTHVLAMGRCGDKIYQTGRQEAIHDHRLVYRKLVGKLERELLVHHIDRNHLNNSPSNLEKHTKQSHGSLHAPDCLTDAARQKAYRRRMHNLRTGVTIPKRGIDNHNWKNLSKFTMLRMLAAAGGRLKFIEMDFETFKRKAELANLNLKVIKDRYSSKGEYVSLGFLRTQFDGSVRSIVRCFKFNYAKAMRMLQHRGVRKYTVGATRNPTGRRGKDCLINNHRIVRIEVLNKAVDVYDIEVESEHNFIANEICVHNSSSNPNFQNIPIRNEDTASLVRKCFIARKGHQLVENDFGGIEVRTICAYNHDPVLIDYVTNDYDMHREQAAKLFKCNKDLITKEVRHTAKNQFVFPEFYGSYYIDCAPNMWQTMDRLKLKLTDGTPLRRHLKVVGIKQLGKCEYETDPVPGTFEHHVRKIEDRLWQTFSVYAQWKNEWWQKYLKHGYIELLTGFVISEPYRRNQVINLPNQGCLAGSSRVLTNKGLIPINQLVGKNVKVWTGFKWASAIGLDRGKCQRARIKLRSGLTVECDTRHKLKNDKDQWVEFQNLEVGSLIALPKLDAPLQASGEITWPFIFGFIVGDGCISDANSKCVTINGGQKKKLVLEKIYQFLKQQGYAQRHYGGAHIYHKKRPGRQDGCQVRLCNKQFAKFLEEKGFVFGSIFNTKKIPKSIWTATPQEQRDFVEGLWKSDGGQVAANFRKLGMSNKKLLQEVQILLSGLGFESNLRKANHNKRAYILYCYWKRKGAKGARPYPITVVRRHVSAVSKSNYSNMCEYITDSRTLNGSKDPYYQVAHRMISANNPQALIYRYDEIMAIEVLDSIETTYTMSVDDDLHQFVADGVIHKNTAFHCLLQVMIWLNNWMRKKKMKSRIVGQIHDSIIGDVHRCETSDYLHMVKHLAEVKLRKHWPWLVTPMVIEAEVCPVDGNWHEKEKVDI